MKNSKYYDLCWLTLILGVLFFAFLGVRPLFVPDEGRYSEIAREMIANHDYITPYLNGIKYFEKPVLFYWLEAITIKLNGLNLWSLRSINAVLGLLTCMLTYLVGYKLYNRKVGWLAALILGTNVLFFVMSHMITLDLPVTFFITATLYGFIIAIHYPKGRRRLQYVWLASVAAACAVLTKGLIGVVFPIAIILCWIILFNNWRLLANLYLPSCILIFLLIALPWHILVGQRNPEFFYFYFIKQHFLRYATLAVGHYQPVWYFIPLLILGFFPWIIFLPQTIKQVFSTTWVNRYKIQNELFFFIWATFIFLFFSFSKSKLIPYILPVFPPLSLLTACYLQQAMENKKINSWKINYTALLAFVIFIACTFFIFLKQEKLSHPIHAIIYLSLAVGLLLLSVLIAYFYLTSDKPKNSIAMTLIGTWFFLFFLHASFPSLDSRSIKPLTEILNPVLQTQDIVITYNQYYQDLPFYLRRQVSVLNWKNELKFGMQYQNTSEWMIDDKRFWKLWASRQRVFAVMPTQEYKDFLSKHPSKHSILGQTTKHMLISNQEGNG